jgi:arylamine N-acetyltransferase
MRTLRTNMTRVHLNTIVTIGDRDYIVDTSHGPSGSPYPVPLVQDEPSVDIWPRQRRMIFDSIPGWSNPNQKWWRLQIRLADTEPWMDVWCFTETEWLPIDFQLIRTGYATLGTGWAAPQVCCFQTIFEDDVPVGYLLILKDELRRNYKGKTEIIQRFYAESDRVEALAEKFGIKLTEDEQKQIVGHTAEIQGDDFDFYG